MYGARIPSCGRRTISLVFFILFASLLSACRGANVIKPPNALGEILVFIRVQDSRGRPIHGASVSIKVVDNPYGNKASVKDVKTDRDGVVAVGFPDDSFSPEAPDPYDMYFEATATAVVDGRVCTGKVTGRFLMRPNSRTILKALGLDPAIGRPRTVVTTVVHSAASYVGYRFRIPAALLSTQFQAWIGAERIELDCPEPDEAGAEGTEPVIAVTPPSATPETPSPTPSATATPTATPTATATATVTPTPTATRTPAPTRPPDFTMADLCVALIPTEGGVIVELRFKDGRVLDGIDLDGTVVAVTTRDGTRIRGGRSSKRGGSLVTEITQVDASQVEHLEVLLKYRGGSTLLGGKIGDWPPCPATPTPTPALTVSGTVTVSQANCRYGDSKYHLHKFSLRQGDRLTVKGRNVLNTWLWVQPEGYSSSCWISRDLVDVGGADISLLPAIDAKGMLPRTAYAPKPQGFSVTRSGDKVIVQWSPSGITGDDFRGYLMEAWFTQGGYLKRLVLGSSTNPPRFEFKADQGTSVEVYAWNLHSRGYSEPAVYKGTP